MVGASARQGGVAPAVGGVACRELYCYSRHRQRAAAELDALLAQVDIDVVPVDLNQAEIARAAFRRYGRGRHPAGLNFGDCFSYALAKATGEPLLFKGTDFGLTDVTPAYRP